MTSVCIIEHLVFGWLPWWIYLALCLYTRFAALSTDSCTHSLTCSFARSRFLLNLDSSHCQTNLINLNKFQSEAKLKHRKPHWHIAHLSTIAQLDNKINKTNEEKHRMSFIICRGFFLFLFFPSVLDLFHSLFILHSMIEHKAHFQWIHEVCQCKRNGLINSSVQLPLTSACEQHPSWFIDGPLIDNYGIFMNF